MWFWFSVIALLFWSGSDLFSKIGCQDAETDKYSPPENGRWPWAWSWVCTRRTRSLSAGRKLISPSSCTYLPVSLLYIVSMALGYVGLRYIELSISSPICNSSGALVAVLCIITGGMPCWLRPSTRPRPWCAWALIGLGIVEAREDEELRRLRQEAANYKYAKSALALVLPILYCVLDALGTFADSKVLETLNEDSANCAYELTFLAGGHCVLCICGAHPQAEAGA
ncbi:MAG: hypothetical protein ACLUNQ_06295 [Oscillospiraceae bacterium]